MFPYFIRILLSFVHHVSTFVLHFFLLLYTNHYDSEVEEVELLPDVPHFLRVSERLDRRPQCRLHVIYFALQSPVVGFHTIIGSELIISFSSVHLSVVSLPEIPPVDYSTHCPLQSLSTHPSKHSIPSTLHAT